MGNKHDITRDAFMLKGSLAKCGYDWWWHSFTGHNKETGEEKSFFIEFFICNPALGGKEPVFGQLEENKKNKKQPSYLMVKAGAWGEDATQLHRFFGWDSVSYKNTVPFEIQADNCLVNEEKTEGMISITKEESEKHPEWMCGDGSMSWNLSIQKDIAFHVGYGASKPLRASGAFEMFWHAEGMKTFYSGEVIWNNTTYLVDPETCYGYADKNWGKDFTSPWVWLSSNNLVSEKTGKPLKNSVFDIGGGRPKIGFIALNRKLLSCFHYEGKDYEFNFSKFWTFTRTKFDCYETDDQIVWNVIQETPRHKMVTNITCEKKDMLFVNYEAPNGLKLHNRLWNGGNGKGTIELYKKHLKKCELIDKVIASNIGCEFGEYDA